MYDAQLKQTSHFETKQLSVGQRGNIYVTNLKLLQNLHPQDWVPD